MIVASYHVDQVVRVVRRNGKVLPRYEHFCRREHDLALIVYHEATAGGQGCVTLKPTHEQKLVIGDVDRLEVVRNVIGRIVLIILQRQLLELSRLLNVVVRAQLVGIEGDQGHREVRIVRNLAYLVNQVNLILQAVEVGKLELGDSEEIRRLFHSLL